MEGANVDKYQLSQWLGYAGLIPFVSLTLMSIFNSDIALNKQFIQPLFEYYSALILVFLCGALWAETLAGRTVGSGKSLLVIANLIVVVVWLVLALDIFSDPSVRLLLYSCFYLALMLSENRLRNFSSDIQRHDSYKRYQLMRWRLTMTVVSCHVLMVINI